MEEIIKKLNSFFYEKKEIIMVFLFGSSAAGREIAESDIDLAVWFGKEYTLKDINQLWREVESLLQRNVDLIILNQARPTIAWAAMRGRPLVIRDYQLFFSKLLEISMEAEDIQDFTIDLCRLREKARREV